MPKYRKRPLVVEAHRVMEFVFGDGDDSIPNWLMVALDMPTGKIGAVFMESSELALNTSFAVRTPSGPVLCRFGDWVVLDQFGYLHPYTDEDFRLIFEEVE